MAEANVDKDEDTDGISIISDSDPESSMPFETSFTKCGNDPPVIPKFVSINPLPPVSPPNNNEELQSIQNDDDDFLGDRNVKHKTYVHRRNKRLSTVLNIIVLGSVITAAGVAIGHMWGAKNDCTINTTPSVNKILSNLYKLQEENAYLRSKLKELTLMNNIQIQQRKSGTGKQNKCKKVFEESLNKIADKPTKCVDHGDISKLVDIDMIETEHEKEFLRDIDKLKNVYKQNKSWLDDEVSKRLKYEEQSIKRMKNDLNPVNKNNKESSQYKNDNFEIVLETITEQPNTDPELHINPSLSEDKGHIFPNRKISYADSLKSDQKIKIVEKRENKILLEHYPKEHNKKKNNIDPDVLPSLQSEEEFKKDDRYVGPKHKQERKKHDRQKLHKKQKRKNKYEQWEMKGGYLKDYDDFSITSAQENEYVLKNPDKNYLAKDFERENYIEQFSETDAKSETGNNKINTKYVKEKHGKLNGKNKEKEITWFEKRAVLRNEARKKLEQELFGETSPNNAGWYFRRMQRREQCRAKGDNSTYKKLLKRNMNFKMKH